MYVYKLSCGNLVITDREKGTINERNYKVDMSSLKHFTKPIQTEVNIYTDGSKTEEHVGAGFIIYHKGKASQFDNYRLSPNATVFQAEVVAIREAVKAILREGTDGINYIKILTDSQATFQALTLTTFTSRIVKETITELNKLGKQVSRLEIAWIKAHIGHEGNEAADKLAKDASEKPQIDLHIPDSWTEYKNTVWQRMYDEWNLEWTSTEKYRMTKEFYPKPDKKKCKEIMNLNRTDMKIWVEIVTGQNNLNYIQSKIYNISSQCRFCEEEDETFYHILNECPVFADTRAETLLTRASSMEDWKLHQIIKFAKTPQIKYALSFDQEHFQHDT